MRANARPAYTDQEVLRAVLRTDLHAFTQKAFETVVPGVRFSQNWATQAMTYALGKVDRGETTRLIINVPPRHLKSVCASVALPASLLAHDPQKKIICVSYSDDLAVKFSNDCRAVIQSDWFKRTFPQAQIDRAKNTETEFRTTKRGYRLATSVGGTLTGRGGDVIIIDDPIKPADAQSEAIRNKTTQWYENTLLSRLDDKLHGAIVLVMQRLHMDDLAGHLIEKGGFELLCLPAIAEEPQVVPIGPGRTHMRNVNDVLDPVREPLSALNKLRAEMTPLLFSAQYQQRPIPLAGNIIKREWLRYFKGDLALQPEDYFVISWDTALKSTELSDYSVGTVWQVQRRGQRKNLVDVVRGRFEYPELLSQAVALSRKWTFPGHTTNLVIEDKGSGSSLIQSLTSKRIYVCPYKPRLDSDKVMRLTARAGEFYAGSIHLRQDAPWLGDLVAELLGFPGVRHDDQVDSLSQALGCVDWLESRRLHHFELRL